MPHRHAPFVEMAYMIKARRDMINEPVRLGGEVEIVTLPRGETLELDAAAPVAGGVTVTQRPGETRLDVSVAGVPFTSYVYDPSLAKPYLGPILLSNGSSVTRLDFKTKEHPHQRSLIVAVGDVCGTDFWNEPKNCGVQRHTGFSDIISGGNHASFTASNIWETADGKPLVAEKRRFTFYNQPVGCRYIDLEITFDASYGDVVFGPTKEAGPLGIRVADSLRADRGGRMINSYGAEGESECWGRCASWCSYSGTVDGLACGIAVFDNEDNERYPTSWHIRDYGLFAANNLYFKGGLTIRAGESLTYRYRICIFEGDVNISDRFLNYVK